MANERISGRLEAVYTLLSPLSHIGSSIGPDSYLVTQDVIGPDGTPTEVFIYSGNAARGMWRDCGAKYMLDKLGQGATLQVPLELFYLLFSGGSIGGDQSIDIDQARRIREKVPHLSVFGGGVGNMLLPGKLNVGEGLPLCRELAHIIPARVLEGREGLANLSWRQQTTELSYTRKDDAKDDILREHLYDPSVQQLEAPKQGTLLPSPDEGQKAKKDKSEDRKPQQMRYTIEALARGAVLWQDTTFSELTQVEMGALVAAITEWAKNPVLGGQARIGMGRVAAGFSWQTTDMERPEPFIMIEEGRNLLSEPAQDAKAAYDEFLRSYGGYLEANRQTLMLAISAKEA